MKQVDTFKKILQKHRLRIHSGSTPKGFTWEPDVLLSENNKIVAFLVRESNTVPEAFVQRMSTTKIFKKSLEINILFFKKPKQNVIRMVSLYGIGVCYIHKGKLLAIITSRSFSSIKFDKKKKVKKTTKMPQTDIFISSHQIIAERGIAEKIINMLNKSYRFPVFPILVEDDSKYGIAETKKCIKENLVKSEWFLAILAEKYRPIVKWEIEEAFRTYFKTEEILVFVKSSKNSSKQILSLINWIKRQKTVKYLPYIDERDFEAKLSRALMQKIKYFHEKLRIPFLR